MRCEGCEHLEIRVQELERRLGPPMTPERRAAIRSEVDAEWVATDRGRAEPTPNAASGADLTGMLDQLPTKRWSTRMLALVILAVALCLLFNDVLLLAR